MVTTFHLCEHIEITKSCWGTDCLRVLVQQRYKSIFFWLTQPQVMAALFILILWSAHSVTHMHTRTHWVGPFVLSVCRVFPCAVKIIFHVPGVKPTNQQLPFDWIMRWNKHTYKGIVFLKTLNCCQILPTVLYFCPMFGKIDCSSPDYNVKNNVKTE